jgi:ubiquitin-protein ligase
LHHWFAHCPDTTGVRLYENLSYQLTMKFPQVAQNYPYEAPPVSLRARLSHRDDFCQLSAARRGQVKFDIACFHPNVDTTATS